MYLIKIVFNEFLLTLFLYINIVTFRVITNSYQHIIKYHKVTNSLKSILTKMVNILLYTNADVDVKS